MTTSNLDQIRQLGYEHLIPELAGASYFYNRGPSERFKDLFSWDALNDILDHHRLEPGRLRLVQDGAEIPLERYAGSVHFRGRTAPTFRSDDAMKLFREGATIVLDAIDEAYEPVRALAENLATRLRAQVYVNAYAGMRPCAGFRTHYDDHDVLVLQIAGRKRWRVYGPHSLRHPLQAGTELTENPPRDPVWEDILMEGDLLYLPRGCWHGALALDAPTLHLSVGIYKPNGVDLLMWLCTGSPSNELFRMDLPLTEPADVQAAHNRALAAVMASVWQDNINQRFYAESILVKRPRFALPVGAPG